MTLSISHRSLRIRDRNRPPRIEDIAATICALQATRPGWQMRPLLEPQSTSAPEDLVAACYASNRS